MGYNQHTARAVVYRPEECGGIGIKNLYVKQLIAQINALIQHTRIESPLGDIPIFEDTKSLYHLEVEWFISIREFLQAT
jgi:hypothetical protein